MSLDQTLTEIEPILRSTDGTFQFTHPSFQEVLTAKQFADEINSSGLSVRDAYVHYWSYEEDAELWDLPKDREWRALLPTYKLILRDLAGLLEEDKFNALFEIISQNYHLCNKHLKYSFYNPFEKEFIFNVELLSLAKYQNPQTLDKTLLEVHNKIGMLANKKYTSMVSGILNYFSESLLEYIKLLVYLNSAKSEPFLIKIFREKYFGPVLRDEIPNALSKVMGKDRYISFLKSYQIRIKEDEFDFNRFLEQLGNNQWFDEILLKLLYSSSSISAAESLLKIGGYDELLFSHPDNFIIKCLKDCIYLDYIQGEGKLTRLYDKMDVYKMNLTYKKEVEDSYSDLSSYYYQGLPYDIKKICRQINISTLRRIKDESFIELLWHENPRVVEDSVFYFRLVGVFGDKERIIKRITDLLDNTESIGNNAAEFFANNGLYDEKLIELYKKEYHQYPIRDCFKKQGDKKHIKLLLPELEIKNNSKDYFALSKIHYTISAIHQRLKPQGYNPPIKRLST